MIRVLFESLKMRAKTMSRMIQKNEILHIDGPPSGYFVPSCYCVNIV
jgi:hypothetical protein